MLPLQNKKPLFFFHLPKTGGESLSDILRRLFLPRQTLPLKVAEHPVCPFNFVHPQALETYLEAQDWSDTRFIYGHGRPWGQDLLAPEKVDTIALLREPLERMLSAFCYSKNKHGYAQSLEELLFKDDPFVMFCNPLTRLFTGLAQVDGTSLKPRQLLEWERDGWKSSFRLSQWPLEEEHFQLAQSHLESITHLGITERFDDFLHSFSEKYTISPSALRYAKKNVTGKRNSSEELDPVLRKRFEELNVYDLRLYEFACNLIARQAVPMRKNITLLRNRPFFSVLIPTRNRPELARQAVESALSQEFINTEIVIIDNNLDDSTKNALNHITDSRYVYLRTGDLSMPDNWEFAFQQAQGEYILLLPDRDVFTSPKSLSVLAEVLEKTGVKIVSYNWATQQNDGRIQWRAYDNKLHRVQSQDLIKAFLNGEYRLFADRAPKGLNCCFHRELADVIRERWGALCPPISPDYTMAYQLLMLVSEYVYFNAPIFTQTHEDISNGSMTKRSSEGVRKALIEWKISEDNCVNHSPSLIPLPINSLYSDLFRLALKNRWPINYSHLNLDEYFHLLAQNIESRAMTGEDVIEILDYWKQEVQRLAPEKYQKIIDRLSQLKGLSIDSISVNDTSNLHQKKQIDLNQGLSRLRRRFLKDTNTVKDINSKCLNAQSHSIKHVNVIRSNDAHRRIVRQLEIKGQTRCLRLGRLSKDISIDGTTIELPSDLELVLEQLSASGKAMRCSELVTFYENDISVPDRVFALSIDVGYCDTLEAIVPILKRFNLPVTVFVQTCGLGDGDAQTANLMQQTYLDKENLLRLAASPLIEIGSYTVSGISLGAFDSQSLMRELRDSKVMLENIIQRPIDLLAYPDGDYNENVLLAARACGYRAAFTTKDTAQATDLKTLLLQIPRMDLNGSHIAINDPSASDGESALERLKVSEQYSTAHLLHAIKTVNESQKKLRESIEILVQKAKGNRCIVYETAMSDGGHVNINDDVEYLFDGAKLFHSRKKLTMYCANYLRETGQNASVIVEIGVDTGNYSAFLEEQFSPKEFVLIDMNFSRFQVQNHRSCMRRLQGYSAKSIPTLDDESVVFAYIDGGHEYATVSDDINKILPKMKKGGIIQFNDYATFNLRFGLPIGVRSAVNHLINSKKVNIVGLGLCPMGFDDIAVRL